MKTNVIIYKIFNTGVCAFFQGLKYVELLIKTFAVIYFILF